MCVTWPYLDGTQYLSFWSILIAPDQWPASIFSIIDNKSPNCVFGYWVAVHSG